MFVAIRFRVRGVVRYLSHAETMRLFQRAFTRAGVRIAHSQGFNPHPKMSLVLPRSVGVESYDELLCVWLEDGAGFDVESLKKQLPEGIDILSAEVSGLKKVPEPRLARYVIKVKSEIEGGSTSLTIDKIKERIAGILASGSIVIERQMGENAGSKQVDVRPYLESIVAGKDEIAVDCKISPAGTVRVDEILSLLNLKIEDLANPVIRESVQYK